MNSDIFAGRWKQLKGRLTVHLGKFSNDQFIVIDGRRLQSAGRTQESSGIARSKTRYKGKRSA